MYEQNDDKHSDASTATVGGIGGRSKHTSGAHTRPPLPHELTAEWTVRAQLTFARAGENVRREFSTNDPVNPVRVVYKWTNLDATNATNADETDEKQEQTTASSSKWSRHSTPFKPVSTSRRSHSFRSTTSSTGHYGGDSAFGGSNGGSKIPSKEENTQNTANGCSESATVDCYGTRCHSTCNIVVSAVADFLPTETYGTNLAGPRSPNISTTSNYFISGEEPEPYTFNTNASYTVLPQKSFEEYSAPATPIRGAGFGRVLKLVDAMCQTSDTETNYFGERGAQPNIHSQSSQQKQQPRKLYEKRRVTADSLREGEGHNSLPSYTSLPAQKSASMSRIPSLSDYHAYGSQVPSITKTGTDTQKKPRTVHIDVYCTGSEDDEQADGEISSSSSENEKLYEIDSTSTPQTVLENEQMRLRHRRINDQTLPRRWAPVQTEQQKEQPHDRITTLSSNMQLGHAITKSSTAEEICESKQLLFRKHIGDQRAAKLQTLRQKYSRQPSSDEVFTSSYATSSHSTMHDATCSSLSSFVPSQHADVVDATWKEIEAVKEPALELKKSDSFEYDNSLDRVRIKRMERFWTRSVSSGFTTSLEDNLLNQPIKLLQTISEGNSQRDSPYSTTFQRNDTLSESEHFPEHESTNSPIYLPQQVTDSPVDSSPTEPPYLQQTPHFPRNRPGFLQYFGPSNATSSALSASIECENIEPTYASTSAKPPKTRWKSESRDIYEEGGLLPPTPPPQQMAIRTERCISESPAIIIPKSRYQSPLAARRFDLQKRDSPASISETSTAPSGYTPEYLELARKFGKVVAARKPGHHVGPTKNPNCACESCQRWLAERFQIRARAFSLGECPVLKRPSK